MFLIAREKRPAIIFIDEIDSMCGERGQGNEGEAARRVKNEFLTQMQGVGNDNDKVLVLAATNVPWEIDPAFRRRFEKRIYIPLPEAPARARMFDLNLGDTPHNLTHDDYAQLGRLVDGFSGSDVAVLVKQALMEPLRKCRLARYWRPHASRAGLWFPVDNSEAGAETAVLPAGARCNNPPCSHCEPDLASRPAARKKLCARCGCARVDLMDLTEAELLVPDVCMQDFLHVLPKVRPSVGQGELKRYDEWTVRAGARERGRAARAPPNARV
jgi:vacuolar protein-sorting-associated protein 4